MSKYPSKANLADARDLQILRLVEKGARVAPLAKLFGMHRTSIFKLLREADVKVVATPAKPGPKKR